MTGEPARLLEGYVKAATSCRNEAVSMVHYLRHKWP